MEILIDKLEFAQRLLENDSTTLNISGKKYKEDYFLMDINVKM